MGIPVYSVARRDIRDIFKSVQEAGRTTPSPMPYGAERHYHRDDHCETRYAGQRTNHPGYVHYRWTADEESVNQMDRSGERTEKGMEASGPDRSDDRPVGRSER